MAENILEVHDLEIRYVTDEETVQAVNDITFSLERGESIGLVGETGADGPWNHGAGAGSARRDRKGIDPV
ncbi:hypothetical protein [Dysosmobacter welbionis]|uniref:hypothetical protein n=1 Tax=Dysosmobacter welbionis TaxID=2093857 RepID=UPI0031F61FD4